MAIRRTILLLLVAGLCGWAHGRTLYVKEGGYDSRDGLTLKTAKATIQAAVKVAANGDTIEVQPGTYDAFSVTGTNRLSFVSSSGAEETFVVPSASDTRCVRLNDGSSIRGFTLTGARGAVLGGAGLYGGTAIDCVITGCFSSDCAGAVNSAVLTNCLVVGNVADGPAVLDSVVYDSTIACNESSNEDDYDQVVGTYETYLCRSIVALNTFTEELDYDPDDDLYQCDGYGYSPYDDTWTHYWTGDPRFVCIEHGDYRLREGSPGAGYGRYPEPVSGFVVRTVRSGTGTIEPTHAVVVAGGSVTFTATVGARPFLGWSLDGGKTIGSTAATLTIPNVRADQTVYVYYSTNLYVDAASTQTHPTGFSTETAFQKIQGAIAAADDGDTINVAPGTYEPITVPDRKIRIVGTGGPAQTVIDARGTNRCVTCASCTPEIVGFTLYYGRTPKADGNNGGGGILYGTLVQSVVSNCYAYGDGGGAYRSTLVSCLVTRCNVNSSYSDYDALYFCTLYGCTIIANGRTSWQWTEDGGSQCYNSLVDRWNVSSNKDTVNFVCPSRGDWRLRAGSKYLDAGDAQYVRGDLDLAGNPRVCGKGVDLGCFEGAVTGAVVVSAVTGLGEVSPVYAVATAETPATFTATETSRPFIGWTLNGSTIVSTDATFTLDDRYGDVTLTAVFREELYVNAATGSDSADGWTAETAKRSLGAAVDKAHDDEVIHVAPGVYTNNITGKKYCQLVADAGPERTILYANDNGICVNYTSLTGFTLRQTANPSSFDRSGTYRAFVQNGYCDRCIIRDCSFDCRYLVYNASLRNSLVCRNRFYMGFWEGGAQNCTVVSNTAHSGRLFYNTTVSNLILWQNESKDSSTFWSSSTVLSNKDPKFVFVEADDYRLRPDSPALDAANSSCASYGSLDLLGQPRIQGKAGDIGCLEGATEAVYLRVGTVGPGTVSPALSAVSTNESQTVTADTSTGRFLGWSRDGTNIVSTLGDYVFTPPLGTAPWQTFRLYAHFSTNLYVNAATGDDANNGASAEYPCKSIASAVARAADGDTIHVAPGTYDRVSVGTKAIRIVADAGPLETTIDAKGVGTCFVGSGASCCTLEGFTLRNGSRSISYPYGSAGVSGAVVRRCRILGCYGYRAAAAYQAELHDCLVSDCVSSDTCCILGSCSLVNCTVRHSRLAGGTYETEEILQDVTATNTLFAGAAVARMIPSDASTNCLMLADPGFITASTEDCRLLKSSPCRNAGLPLGDVSPCDLYGHPRILDGALDIGASEYAGETCLTVACPSGAGSVSPAGGNYLLEEGRPLEFTASSSVRAFLGWTTNGAEICATEPTFVVPPRPGTERCVLTALFETNVCVSAGESVQAAIDGCYAGDLIHVPAGVYPSVSGPAFACTVVSDEGPSATVIDGGFSNRCVTGNSRGFTVRGFTLRHGRANDTGVAAQCATLERCIVISNGLDSVTKPILVDVTVRNSLVTHNYRTYGYTLAKNATFVGCTLADNFTSRQSTLVMASCTATNTVIAEPFKGYVSSGSSAVLSDIPPTVSNTKLDHCWLGNDPGFFSRTECDYRLLTSSALLDAGTAAAVTDPYDLSGNPRIVGSAPDIGCYEGAVGSLLTCTAVGLGSVSPASVRITNGGSATFTTTATGDRAFVGWTTNGVDIFSTAASVTFENIRAGCSLQAVYHHWLYVDGTNGNDANDGLSADAPLRSIACALALAKEDDIINVAPGVYPPLAYLPSSTSPSCRVVATEGPLETVIDGGGTNRCVTFNSYSNPIGLDGFHLRRGATSGNGAGAYYGHYANCWITDCRAQGDGGGTHTATLTDCVLSDNVSRGSGGGSYKGRATDCCYLDNRARSYPDAYSTSRTRCTTNDTGFVSRFHRDFRRRADFPGKLLAEVRWIGPGTTEPSHALVAPGESVTFVTNAADRAFLGWSTNGIDICSTEPTFTVRPLSADIVLAAVFETNLYVTAGESIQDVLDTAVDGDTIHVAPGTYAPIEIDGRNVRIVADSGPLVTAIDGGRKTRCASLGLYAAWGQATLVGFTLRNGRISASTSDVGAGALGGVLEDCWLWQNRNLYGKGAALSTCVARNCHFARNVSYSGADCVDSTLEGAVTDEALFVWPAGGDLRLKAEVEGSVVGVHLVGTGEVTPRAALVTTDTNLTFTATETVRPFLGWSYDGVTLVSTSPTFAFQLQTLNYKLQTLSLYAHFATNLYVSAATGSDENDGLSSETAKATIRGALAVACEDETILVGPGTYASFGTSALPVTLLATGGADVTFVDAKKSGRCANLVNANSIVDGFTFLNGAVGYNNNGAGIYGGIVRHSVISNCSVTYDHYVFQGGAAYGSRLENCLVVNNECYGYGGALSECTAYNCTITGNRVRWSSGYVLYNTTLYNSIFYGNSRPGSDSTDGGTAGCTFHTCCRTDPGFVAPETHDYRLKTTSSCRDAGRNAYVKSATDLSGAIRLQGACVDIGCYEATPRTTCIVRTQRIGSSGTVTPSLAEVEKGADVTLQAVADRQAFLGWRYPDGEIFSTEASVVLLNVTDDVTVEAVFDCILRVDGTTGDDANDGKSEGHALRTIAAALARAEAGDEIVVAPGVYEPFYCIVTGIVIRASGGPDVTFIDGGGTNACVQFSGGETESVLRGFTLLNGVSPDSAWGVSALYGGHAIDCVISNCVVRNSGGVAYGSILEHCLVVRNRSTGNCPGLLGGWAYTCTFANNTSTYIYSSEVRGAMKLCAARDCIFADGLSKSDKSDADSAFVNCYVGASPGFVSPDNDDWRLAADSPCVGRGVGYYGETPGYAVTFFDSFGASYSSPYVVVPAGGSATVSCSSPRAFIGWYAEGALYSTENPLMLTGLTRSFKLEAVFSTELYVNGETGDNANDGFARDRAKKTIPAAAAVALDGDTIRVARGVYAPFTLTKGKLTIESEEGPALTIIDAQSRQRCVTLANYPTALDEDRVLRGFTLVNGYVNHSGITGYGGGAFGGRLERCIIRDCWALYASAAYYSALYDCLVHDNYSQYADVLLNCSATGCTVADNEYPRYWSSGPAGIKGGTVRNSIVCGNTDGDLVDCEAENVTTNRPDFVGASYGDYRVWSGSPTVNAGSNAFVVTSVDLAGAARIQDGTVDLGCYEGALDGEVAYPVTVSGTGDCTPQSVVFTNETMDVTFTAIVSTRAFLHFLTNGVPVAGTERDFTWRGMRPEDRLTVCFSSDLYVDAVNGSDANDGTMPARAKRTIQAAANLVVKSRNETVHVAPGRYAPFSCSTYPSTFVADAGWRETVIDGGGTNQCATLGYQVRIDGFHLVNGFAQYGGGVYYGRASSCVIESCRASWYGGGAYGTSLSNCVVRNCRAGKSGGALYNGSASHCTLVDNDSTSDGTAATASTLQQTICANSNDEPVTVTKCTLTSSCVYQRCGDIANYPRFFNATNGDYRVLAESPAEGLGAFPEETVPGYSVLSRVHGHGEATPFAVCRTNVFSATYTAFSPDRTFLGWSTNGCELIGTEATFTVRPTAATTILTAFFTTNLYVNAATGDDAFDGLTPATAKRSLQTAIDAAYPGEIIHVASGVYAPIDTRGKNLRILSEGGPDVTVLDGGGTNACAVLADASVSPRTNAFLLGFTLVNGRGHFAGGAWYGTLSRCIVTNCSGGFAGGTYYSTLWDSLIRCCVSTGDYTRAATAYGGSFYNVTAVAPDDIQYATRSVSAYNSIIIGRTYGSNDPSLTYSTAVTVAKKGNLVDENLLPYADDAAYASGSLAYIKNALDLKGNRRITNVKVNRGCYEGYAERYQPQVRLRGAGKVTYTPSRVLKGGSVTFTATETTRDFRAFVLNGKVVSEDPVWTWTSFDPNVVPDAVFETNLYVNVESPDDLEDGFAPERAKKTFAGLYAIAAAGDCFHVAPGTYPPLVAQNLEVSIVADEGPSVTFFDGANASRAATLTPVTTLSGFTLVNGRAEKGGGVMGGTLLCSVISNCFAATAGGGAYDADVLTCLLVDNVATNGGGAAEARLWGCTLTANEAVCGGGVYGCVVTNVIVYGNAAVSNAETAASLLASTLTSDPLFAEVENRDWRLIERSPAVGNGDAQARRTATDLLGAPRLTDGETSVGCYEGGIEVCYVTPLTDGLGTLSASRTYVPPGRPVTFTATETYRTFLGFSRDASSKIVATTSPWTVPAVWDDITVTAWFDRNAYVKAGESIQAAIDLACDGDTIHLSPGVYAPFDSSGRTLTITGGVSGVTCIDGGGTNRCATLGATADARGVTLSNVMLVNGSAAYGGGAYGGTLDHVVISNCVATVDGGALYGGDATRLLAVHCAAGRNGGGATGSTLHHVTIAACSAPNGSAASGGAAFDSILAGTAIGGRLENSFAGAAEDVGFVSVKYEDWRLAHLSPNIGRGYYDGSVPVTLIDVCVGVGHGAVTSDVSWTTADYPVTVTADDSLRPFVGWYDAATNLVSTSPTFALQLQTLNYKLQTLSLFAHFQTNLYLNAVSGDDSFDGFTPETAKRTTTAMADFVLDGEAVSVAPGTYAPFALDVTNVAFAATGGYSNTVVTGGVQATDQSVFFDGFAFGPGAITGGAFAQSTFVETAITNAALTDCSVYGTATNCIVTRSIVWHDDARSNFNLQTLNSYLSDPIYVEPENGDLRVAEYSPCVTGGVVWCGAVKETVPRPSPPVITPADGTTFVGSTLVSITSDSPEAKIWYTATGRTPRLTDAYRYKGSFSVTTTVTVKAILKVGRLQSMSASATLTVEIPAVDTTFGFDGFVFEPDGDADWTIVTEDDAPALRSGRISANGVSSLLFVTNEPGVVSFAWKCDTEEDPTGACTWDNLAVYVDGAVAPFAAIDGATDWQTVKVRLSGDGEHTILWQYAKDGYDDPDFVTEDAGWLRAFAWTAGDPIPDLGASPTLDAIIEALTGSADTRLLTYITDATGYNGYRAWAVRLQDECGIDMETIRNHPRAWYSYALEQDALLAREFIEGDLSVKSLAVSATAGVTLTLALDDVSIGDGATEENLKKVFGLTATTALGTKAFSSADLTLESAAPQDGRAVFVVKPVGTPKSFFLKAEVQP